MSKVFCFGTSGGCLDSFYLFKEIFHDSDELLFLSDHHDVGESICDHKVAGSFQYAVSIEANAHKFIYQCGSVHNHQKRHLWFKRAIENGMTPITLISDKAYIHPTASIGRGSIIYPGVRIMANAQLGENSVVLSNTVINHDASVGDYCVINSSCVLNGGVILGNNCYIGSSSSIKENVTLLSNITLGMSSVVLKSLDKTGLYFGFPAKFIQ